MRRPEQIDRLSQLGAGSQTHSTLGLGGSRQPVCDGHRKHPSTDRRLHGVGQHDRPYVSPRLRWQPLAIAADVPLGHLTAPSGASRFASRRASSLQVSSTRQRCAPPAANPIVETSISSLSSPLPFAPSSQCYCGSTWTSSTQTALGGSCNMVHFRLHH